MKLLPTQAVMAILRSLQLLDELVEKGRYLKAVEPCDCGGFDCRNTHGSYLIAYDDGRYFRKDTTPNMMPAQEWEEVSPEELRQWLRELAREDWAIYFTDEGGE